MLTANACAPERAPVRGHPRVSCEKDEWNFGVKWRGDPLQPRPPYLRRVAGRWSHPLRRVVLVEERVRDAFGARTTARYHRLRPTAAGGILSRRS
jgi:hypothetical protein